MAGRKSSNGALAKSKRKLSAGPAEKKTKKDNERDFFYELFLDELKDIYWAEKHLVKNLPKIVKAATTEELRESVSRHLEETVGQVERLEKVFELLGEKVQGKKCDAMEGLVQEAASCIEDTEKGTYTRDAGLIVCAQKVEHYEIASYGSLAEFAKTLGREEAAALLEETLAEEKAADHQLNAVATSSINKMAMEEWSVPAETEE